MKRLKERHLVADYIPEPKLEFGYQQTGDHPKDGLYLFGPSKPPTRPDISVGVIGSADGLGFFREWIVRMSAHIPLPKPGPRDKKQRPHLSEFPGLEEAFGIRLSASNLIEYEIGLEELYACIATENPYEAVSKTTDLFLRAIEKHDLEEEQAVDVWVFVLPEVVFENCRPEKIKRRKIELHPGEFIKKQKQRVEMPLLDNILDNENEYIFDDVPDFHRQVKARLLKLGYPSQLVRETTLAPQQFLNSAGKPKRGTQDEASIAWNLGTGLFYKTQAEPPWKLANMRPGVCYIGLVFKQIPNHAENHACCAAQMFLSEGDGVVFRGANGPWQSNKFEFHLNADAAKKLISTVLDTYKSKFREYPKELFIHGQTVFSDEEWEAFASAAPVGTNIVGIRIKPSYGEMKLYREGDYPTVRGTALLLSDTDAFLWTTGFVPRLDTYMGPETPNPIFVTILRSSGQNPPISQVLADIHGLTKVNYNACNFSDALPVTIRFANKVGEVLVMGSAEGANRQPFKFYI
ncbi:MAG: hypothetical protein AAFQ34_02635 [Pseudomonadota bacterium]